MHVAPAPQASPPQSPAAGPEPRRAADSGPLAQSVALTFRLIGAVTAIMALIWACSNVRQVTSDRVAVVERFGKVVRVQQSGLLLAWPAPIEQIRMLPAPSRQIPLAVAAEATGYVTDETDLELQPNDDVIHMERDRDAANASYLLTGDGNVVRLEATLFFRITDPAAYVMSESHVAPALRRLFLASSVSLAASHRLDDFLVAQPADGQSGNSQSGNSQSGNSQSGGSPSGDSQPGESQPANTDAPAAEAADPLLVARRQALRGDLVQAINMRLASIGRASGSLGVELVRADLVAVLPPRAKQAFDEVLTASQIAEQNVAAARTDAAHIGQDADRERDRVLAEADAVATERIRDAATDIAPVTALQDSVDREPSSLATTDRRAALLLRAWRQRVAEILRKSGEVTVIDASIAAQTILPGPSAHPATMPGDNQGSPQP